MFQHSYAHTALVFRDKTVLLQKYERILCSAHCRNVATFIGLTQNSFTGENTFFENLTSRKSKRRTGKHVDRLLWLKEQWNLSLIV